MKAFEWIDRIKTERGIQTDYAVAKLLGVKQSNITVYRKRESTMDEDASINVANILGIPVLAVVLDQTAERAKSPEIRDALFAEAKRVCILC